MQRTNSLNSGHRACQGCGEALGRPLRDRCRDARDPNQLVAVNATGCLEVFSTPYPETSWQLPWIHSLFGNAAAVASGVAAAQRVKGRPEVRVIAQGGDGGTTDIGFGCLSGMFERNDDVLYICYDNEAYMNTGVQRSSATPPAARTATTPAVGASPGNVFGTGKNVPRIAMAHRIPVRRDGERVQPARSRAQGDLRDGPSRRALHPHLRAVSARLGVRACGHDQARAAGRRDRPVSAVRGARRLGHRADADPAQGSCDGVSEAAEALCPPVRQSSRAGRIARIQQIADRNIAEFGLLDRDSEERLHGQAVRDNPRRRLEPRQQDGCVAHEPTVVRRSASALQPRLPCRREHPGLAVSRRVGGLRSRVAGADRGQSAARDHGSRLLSPVRGRMQSRARSTRRSGSIRSSASSATRR